MAAAEWTRPRATRGRGEGAKAQQAGPAVRGWAEPAADQRAVERTGRDGGWPVDDLEAVAPGERDGTAARTKAWSGVIPSGASLSALDHRRTPE